MSGESRLTRRRFLGASAGLGGAAMLGGGVYALLSDDGANAARLADARAARAEVASRGMSVVLICLDSVRADHVGAYRGDGVRPHRPTRTPAIDDLARQGLRFRHARPEALPTGPTRRSVYTGIRTFPMDDWKPDPDSPAIYGWQHIPERQATLVKLLGAAGYRTALATDNTWMLKPSWGSFRRSWDEVLDVHGQVNQRVRGGRSVSQRELRQHLPPGLADKPADKVLSHRGVIERYLANAAGRRREEDWYAPQVFRAATRWLERHADSTQPFFLTIDSFDPHEPWDPPRKYVDLYDDPEYRGIDPIFPMYGTDDHLSERLRRRMGALYQGELTMADHWMGTFLERLDALGVADRTLVVFYSDHGVSLSDRGYVGKQPSQVYAEMVDVPLVIRHPEGRAAGVATDYLAQLHDIAPTILATVGVPIPEAMEGHDLSPLLAGEQPERERKIQTAGYNEYVWAGDARHSFIASNRKANPKLFDRERDPRERRNLADERPDDVERFWKAILDDAGGKPPPRY